MYVNCRRFQLACECLPSLDATHPVGSLASCCTARPPSLPSRPHSAEPTPWRRDYPLPCLLAVGRGSRHGACHAWACPLQPAGPFSSAQHSRDSRTEPEANLSLPHSSGKMISVFSPLLVQESQWGEMDSSKTGYRHLFLLKTTIAIANFYTLVITATYSVSTCFEMLCGCHKQAFLCAKYENQAVKQKCWE